MEELILGRHRMAVSKAFSNHQTWSKVPSQVEFIRQGSIAES